MIIEAAKRLKAHIEMAMSLNRKVAMTRLTSGQIFQLRDHFALLQIFPNDVDVTHWQIESRAFLLNLLDCVQLKSNKVLPMSDFIKCVWETAGEPNDFERSVTRVLTRKGWKDRKSEWNYEAMSLDYKHWLTKWYLVYVDPHTEDYDLPERIF